MDEHFEHLGQPEEDSGIPEQGMPVFPKAEPPAPRAKGALIPALCGALIGSLLGSAITIGVYQLYLKDQAEQNALDKTSFLLESRREKVRLETIPIDGASELTPAQVYAAYVDATVGITTAITTNFWGFPTTSAASGSGFILTEDGYILTNYHVIEDSDKISVSLYDGTSYDADLVGYDESNDIAVLKVDAEGLLPVVIGNSDYLNVGDPVLAIGNPLGELTFSLTAGTISATDRQVTFSGSVTMDLIQTDCAINSGNSGGALFNLYGEVVGITNAKYSGSSGSGASIDNIGFAIPMNTVTGIIKSIIEKGYISKPYLGISVSTVGAEAQSYGIPAGAAIQSVAQDSPAQKAGLQAGDVIIHINGTTISDSSILVEYVGDSIPGDTLHITLYRQGDTMDITAYVGETIQSARIHEEQSRQTPAHSSGWGVR